MNVANKVVIVTGAASGMGKELTHQLVKMGAKVAMLDKNETALKTASAEMGSNVAYKVLNITDKAAVKEIPEWVIATLGQVDILINNAGIIQPFIPVKDLDENTIVRVMDINFYGTLYMTQAFLPYFLKRPEAHIVNISSMGGFMPFPGQTIYGTSKAAVKLFTEGLYAELKDTNVRVTIIHPGAINTNIMSNSGIKSAADEAEAQKDAGNKTLPADQAAKDIIAAIEKNKYRAMIGKDAKMMDLMYRLMPRKAVDMIVKQMAKRNH